MPKLKYSSLQELQKKNEIQPDLRKKLHLLTCDKAFDSYLNIYKTAALSGGDPENQYILYYRCGEIGKMIIQKNGFKDGFSRKDELRNTFTKMLESMNALEKQLIKQYEENKIEDVPNSLEEQPKENNGSLRDVPVQEPISLRKSLCIKARDLVRLVENEKKTAIIIDFRLNQNTKNIAYKKGSANPILIMSIPRELIKPGLLFSALKYQLPVGQRPLLNKISACDYVVMMDSGSPKFLNDEPIPSTEAGILNLALTEYNTHDKLQSTPLFMEGGFESWILQYPMYVNSVEHNIDLQCGDSLAAMVAGYKRATLPFDYPELSPKKMPKQVQPSVTEETAETSVKAAERMDETQLTDKSDKTEPNRPGDVDPHLTNNEYVSKELSNSAPERPPKPSDLLDESSKVTPSSPKVPRLAGGQSVVSIKPEYLANISNMKISEHKPPEKPIFSRADKPGELRPKSPLTPSVNHIQPRTTTSMPALDRSTKPNLTMPIKHQEDLMKIYSLMAQNIADNAVAEHNTPGQTGLYNMRNTCFMSACLQALFQTPQLVKIFTKDYFIKKVNIHNRLGTKGVISAVFSALVDNVWSGYFKAFKPKRFLTLFATEVNEMLMNGEQQDASEFYMLLLGTLHEDTSEVVKAVPPVQNYSGENIRREAADFEKLQLQFSCSPISRLMHPRTVAEVTCSSCKKKSVKFEDINIIQVGLPPPRTTHASLVDCLHNSFCATKLDGLWDCPHCKVPRAASQKLSLWKLPTVIVIHLLRFSFTGGDYVKNDIPVSFDPEKLDMSPFLHSAADRHGDSAYRLYSVTNHRGRLNSGHYTAYCRHLRTGDWLRFDDEYVTRAAASDISFSDAYILYFKKVKD